MTLVKMKEILEQAEAHRYGVERLVLRTWKCFKAQGV
jgi:hypothetical protein